MSEPRRFRALVLSVVKHAYIAQAVRRHPRFELVAVADDVDQPPWVHERNQTLADECDIAYVQSPEEAFDKFEPDLAVISSPAERHCDLAVRAAQHGLHVIVDKPLSNRLSECERLVRAVDEAGVKCLVWNRNFLPALLQTKDAIETGAIGAVRAIHCDFYFSKDAGIPKGARQPGYPPINWLQRQIEAHVDGSDGGIGESALGELQVEGIYPLAYFRMLTGLAVERVFARTTAHFHQAHADNNVDDLATVTLEMEGEVAGSLCLGRIGAASHPDIGEIKLHVIGEKGALVINESRPEVALYYRDQPPREFRHLRIGDENGHLLMEDFANAIDNDQPTILDARAGRDICAIVEACLRSAQSGQVEKVGS